MRQLADWARRAIATPRYVLLWMCCLNALVSYADRTNIAIAILPMSEEFGWSKSRRGFVLSVFYYGYACTQLPAGYLAQRVGGKWLLAISCALWSLFTVLTPVAAWAGLPWLTSCRIALGLAEGFGFPSIMALVAEHVPDREHGRAVAFVFGGCYAGAVLANLVSVRLVAGAGGWPSIFYVFGGAGLAWLVPWVMFRLPPAATDGKFKSMDDIVHTAPARVELFNLGSGDDTDTDDENAPTEIFSGETAREQTFTFENQSLPSADSSQHHWRHPGPARLASPSTPAESSRRHRVAAVSAVHDGVPWLRLLRTRQMFAYLVANFTQAWSFWLMINWLPSYYQDVFHAELKDIGMYTVVPYVVQGLLGNVAGMAADWLIHGCGVSKLTVRRWMQFGGMVGMSTFTMLAVLLPSNIETGAVLISCAMGMYTLTFAGVSVNHLDIAPQYASTVYGLGNTAGQVPGIVGVWLTGWMLDATGGNWLVVFGVAAVISLAGALIWLVLCGAEPLIPVDEHEDDLFMLVESK